VRVLLLVALACAGCADRRGGVGPGGDGLPDGFLAYDDGGLPDLSAGAADLGGADLAGADLAGSSAHDLAAALDLAGGALDPNLSLPDPNGQVCATPGHGTGCPSLQTCRFFNASAGRCESCAPCGNLNALCTKSAECDILFVCYKGRCTNFCTLGTYNCGAITDCVDVGHPTHGVCKP
jgi:hypothetical protein